MRERRIKRLPVAKNGKLLGMVSLSDLAALASAEADRLRPSLRFFTDVLGVQSSQHRPPKGASPQKQLTSLAAESAENDKDIDLLDAGGPG
jgi:CBS domain-containing protein